MKNKSFRVDVFCDVTSKDSISPEKVTKPNNFQRKKCWFEKINFNFFTPRNKKHNDIQPSAPPEYSKF